MVVVNLSDLFQGMPVIVLDLKLPAPLEDGVNLVRTRANRLKRRLWISLSRKWSILRYGLREVFENFKRTEDKKPILKREGLSRPDPLFTSGSVGWEDVDLTGRTPA